MVGNDIFFYWPLNFSFFSFVKAVMGCARDGWRDGEWEMIFTSFFNGEIEIVRLRLVQPKDRI